MIYILKIIHYFYLMFLNILEKFLLKSYHLGSTNSLPAPGSEWKAALKRTEVTLELLTDIEMLLMV